MIKHLYVHTMGFYMKQHFYTFVFSFAKRRFQGNCLRPDWLTLQFVYILVMFQLQVRQLSPSLIPSVTLSPCEQSRYAPAITCSKGRSCLSFAKLAACCLAV